MSQFLVSARKYRPLKFSDVVGQEKVTNTLRNAMKTNQLAQSFLFCGPRGVGKTTCARILAKVINCENPQDNFNYCEGDKALEINSMSIFELDAASNNGVEHIRELTDQVRFAPPEGKKKVYIIDEVHMLSTNAFNAFLKTLEEPPPYAIFILATTEKHKILPTILSRCQIFDFSRITIDDIVAHLEKIAEQEGVESEKEALHIIAQKADGALRDALSIFDRMVIFGQGKITYESVITNLNILDYDYYFQFIDYFLSENVSAALSSFNEIQQKGFEGEIFLSGLAEHFRNLLVAQDQSILHLLDVSTSLKEKYLSQAKLTPHSLIVNALDICNKTDIGYKAAKNKRLHIEMALIKLSYLTRLVNADNVSEKKNLVPNQAAFNTTAQTKVQDHSPEKTEKNAPEKVEAKAKEVEKPTAETIVNNDAQPKVLPQKNGSSPKGIFSLKDLEAEVTAEINRKKSIANEALTLEKLKSLIEEFMQNEMKSDENLARSALKYAEVKVDDQLVKLITTTTLQSAQIEEVNKRLLPFLKNKSNNSLLKIEVILEEKEEEATEKIPYSPKEKLKKMAEQNPAVSTLIEKLDLRIRH